jgi:hypothetical protein
VLRCRSERSEESSDAVGQFMQVAELNMECRDTNEKDQKIKDGQLLVGYEICPSTKVCGVEGS